MRHVFYNFFVRNNELIKDVELDTKDDLEAQNYLETIQDKYDPAYRVAGPVEYKKYDDNGELIEIKEFFMDDLAKLLEEVNIVKSN